MIQHIVNYLHTVKPDLECIIEAGGWTLNIPEGGFCVTKVFETVHVPTKHERVYYVLEGSLYTPASYMEPEDVAVYEIGTYERAADVAMEILKTMAGWEYDNAFESAEHLADI
jgi:hypothetical protein